MKHILITSMLALGVGCGAAMAQAQAPAEVQPSGDNNCAAGTADCQKGGKAGEQAQGKAKMKTNEQAQGKAKAKTDEQAQGKAGATTDEQAQGKAKVKTDEQAQGKAGATTDQQAQGKATVKTDEQAQGKTSTQPDQGSTASITNVTVEQKTEITNVIRETKITPVDRVDFDISVGTEVPRHKVRLHRLPPRIVKIVPAYETYEYFVLADGRIVIVDPDTLKIVIILT
ncbi:DUF1236 domain-containing protein [Mesorhizobium sp. M4B.F.Ca.ET.215.01.1.1]|uniref:DUF1236 domain-containing protein n=1 Tax=unclassified Mesorhizobium TaxID=325217 RepID=UPI000FC9B12F|nr:MULTISPECIES: DUF1236 domain-containing protein [unclassified Mesorhizobium]RUW22559.1 DUF1236 domain-containing protein [Mesorhizobium sp. M4B.F.Ca.ET.013.02.1.1]RVD37129.1 DUF1236 domain-containing protein [Mesorhizobium sp. M4B.F.Ca.ET.019.03.1.1]RWF62249.1 MAG: DUF1236 domain-containing protein [Mesorhizobium sp.]TGQ12929.1 DUF1236 domain-containing protein [Mesorhizobium sp. M4B.F.Ca.ET.215.01.1.1]TGQ43239.1 DUF1236 domain-containing protein [Mesorhizobium sp. M4B.F.Ca.ET.214.01.1.1]